MIAMEVETETETEGMKYMAHRGRLLARDFLSWRLEAAFTGSSGASGARSKIVRRIRSLQPNDSTDLGDEVDFLIQ
jgi:hypothetical protein